MPTMTPSTPAQRFAAASAQSLINATINGGANAREIQKPTPPTALATTYGRYSANVHVSL